MLSIDAASSLNLHIKSQEATLKAYARRCAAAPSAPGSQLSQKE